jgi:microcystin-dependent protein
MNFRPTNEAIHNTGIMEKLINYTPARNYVPSIVGTVLDKLAVNKIVGKLTEGVLSSVAVFFNEGVNAYLARESESIKTSNAVGFLPRGIIIAIGSTQINNWFNINGVGLGEYAGWYLCDGRNDTPDLRGRFLMGRDVLNLGSDYSEVGKQGGSSQVQLSETQIPAHQHDVKITSSISGNHVHDYKDIYFYNLLGGETRLAGGSNYHFRYSDLDRKTMESGSHTHQIEGKTSSTGQSKPIDIRNPYYVVAYIIYKGFL